MASTPKVQGNVSKTITVSEEAKARAAEIQKAIDADPTKLTVLPDATQADMVKETQSPTLEEPKRQIESKNFTYLKSTMAGRDRLTVTMTFQDVVDRTAFDDQLYDVPVQNAKQRSENLMETWQRARSKKHVDQIVDYLLNRKVNFFPALICIPAKVKFVENGDNTITIEADMLGVLDGQHRKAAIEAAIKLNPDLAKETMSVDIWNVDSLEDRQQVFADVNGTPAKVTKALSSAFNHADKITMLAKQIMNEKFMMSGNGSMVAVGKTTPPAKANQIISLNGLINLISPLADVKMTVDDIDPATGQNKPKLVNRLSAETITNIVKAVIEGLPDIKKVEQGSLNYEQLKTEYFVYYSTAWNALAQVLAVLAKTKVSATNQFHYSDAELPEMAAFVMSAVGKDGWKFKNPMWSSLDRMVIDPTGKVGTQKDHVARAAEIIAGYLNDALKAAETQGK